MSVVFASFHLAGSMILAGGATNGLNSYPLLILGKVVAAIGDGSLDNAQHRIFSTYFAPGRGFAGSIGSFCLFISDIVFLYLSLTYGRRDLVGHRRHAEYCCTLTTRRVGVSPTLRNSQARPPQT